jgi:hypothetical protein
MSTDRMSPAGLRACPSLEVAERDLQGQAWGISWVFQGFRETSTMRSRTIEGLPHGPRELVCRERLLEERRLLLEDTLL